MAERTLDDFDGGVDRLGKLDQLVRLGIVFAFILLCVLSYTRNVNWDEFYFLSHIYAFVDGRLDRPMQTFFVHGFDWLTQIPGNEMDQIFVARLLMVGFVGITALSIHRIARHLTDGPAASIAVLAFLTSGFVLPHGASFRADPIAAALLCASVALIMTTRMQLLQVVIAAGLSALALLTTIKAAMFAPAFLAAMLWRWNDKGVVLRTMLAGALTVCIFLVLYTWHAAGIVAAPGKDTATNARDAATTTLLNAGLFPRITDLVTWAVFSLAPITLAIVGLASTRNFKTALMLVCLATPLLSVVVYRNAFPYFFPFAVPLLMVAAAYGAQRLRQSRWLMRLVVITLVTGAGQVVLSIPENTATQRAVVTEVHRLFPEPVPYIDNSNMIASFPSAAFFMSSWQMQNYRADGEPVVADWLEPAQPPLLIANKPTLIDTMTRPDTGRFLPEDDLLLRNSYIQYNGPIWLAGRSIRLNGPAQVTLPFAGNYRVETAVPVTIDGQSVADGAVLSVGDPISVTGPSGTDVRFIWDTGVVPLQSDLPTGDVFAGFWMLKLW